MSERSARVRFDYRPPVRARGAPPRTQFIFEGPDRDDHILSVLRERAAFYELDLLTHLLLRGPMGGLFVDVGANFGNHAVFFGTFLADHVVAIEPNARLVELLSANLERNDVSAVVRCIAAGRAPGRGRLVVDARANLGSARVVSPSARAPDAGRSVPVDRLDTILASARPEGSGPIRLLKIDVEHMGADVLAGASEILRTDRPQVVIEAETEAERVAVDAILRPLGYRTAGRFCATPTFHYVDPSRHRLRPVALGYRARWLLGRIRAFATRRAVGTGGG